MRERTNRILQQQSLQGGINRRQYYFVYSVVFIVCVFVVYSWYITTRMTFIWEGDGFWQHYQGLIYYSRWLREVARTIFVNHSLDIPMFSFSMGYGSDIYTTLTYYVIGDPFTILSVFVPIHYMAYYFTFAILLRLYLAGAAFSEFCFYIGKRKSVVTVSIILGALTYIFCGYSLMVSVRHPYFINPMIYYPLICVGIEKIFNRKSPGLYVGMVFIAALSNFYFFYHIVVLTIIYAVFRVLSVYDRWTERIKTLFKLLFQAILGVCMSAVTLLPTLMVFFDSNRLEVPYSSTGLYALTIYRDTFAAFLSPRLVNYNWTYMGFSALALVAVLLLLIQKKDRNYKLLFIMLTIITLIPILGKVMNGFSYPSNRWVWGYGFFISVLIVYKWEDLIHLSGKDRRNLFTAAVIYFIICLLVTKTQSNSAYVGMAFVFVFLGVIFFSDQNKYYSASLILLLILNLGMNAHFLYAPYERGFIEENLSNRMAISRLNSEESQSIRAASESGNDFFRYSGQEIDHNNSTYSGLHSTDFFWSLSGSTVPNYRTEMEFSEATMSQSYRNLDSRAMPMALAQVKYLYQDSCIPYGYTKTDVDDVWENQYFIPFGYTYDYSISTEEYQAMTALEKQEALMQGCVLNTNRDDLRTTIPNFTSKKVKYNVVEEDGLSVSDNSITVKKEKATLKLNIDSEDNSETYIRLSGFDYSGLSPKELLSYGELSSITKYDQRVLLHEELGYIEYRTVSLNFVSAVSASDATDKLLPYMTSKYDFYPNRHDFLVNLGYDREQGRTVTIEFPETGIYSFESMEAFCQPMDDYPDQVRALSENTMSDVNFHNNNEAYVTNRVTGTISLDASKFLLLSIPYSEGWSAYVDGEETELYQANTMFMALELGEGNHSIELHYQTPGFRGGCIISLLSILLYALIIFIERRKSRSEMNRL